MTRHRNKNSTPDLQITQDKPGDNEVRKMEGIPLKFLKKNIKRISKIFA